MTLTDVKPETKVATVLQLLKTFANERGYVKGLGDNTNIAKRLGLNAHDTAKMLHVMRREQLIGFTTRKMHGASVLIRFRVTKKGMEMGQAELEPIQNEVEHEVEQKVEVIEIAEPEYPTIRALLHRKELAYDAHILLAKLGAEELAIKALELGDKEMTELEIEVFDFFDRFQSMVRFLNGKPDENGSED